MFETIYQNIRQKKEQQQKLLAVLIDPDTPEQQQLQQIVKQVNEAAADLIFVGGSLLVKDDLDRCLQTIKENTSVPVLLFPGSVMQVSDKADAILFLSLISGRNPDLLIGQQVIAAPYLKQSQLEVLSTGYMLVDSGRATTAGYMSNSRPIPHNKPQIAACTAMAGEMMGMKLSYLDAGSGADKAVSEEMVQQVQQAVDTPLIVGGGIRQPDEAGRLCRAGADVIVVGNATEKDPAVIAKMAEAVHNG